jgi:hypothetical protein
VAFYRRASGLIGCEATKPSLETLTFNIALQLLWLTTTLKRYRCLKRAISSFNRKAIVTGFFYIDEYTLSLVFLNDISKFLQEKWRR